jgi:hypothetical protein
VAFLARVPSRIKIEKREFCSREWNGLWDFGFWLVSLLDGVGIVKRRAAAAAAAAATAT